MIRRDRKAGWEGWQAGKPGMVGRKGWLALLEGVVTVCLTLGLGKSTENLNLLVCSSKVHKKQKIVHIYNQQSKTMQKLTNNALKTKYILST